MVKAVAINGSPRMAKGNTAIVLAPFLDGLMEAGVKVELFYASRLKVKPCACSAMQCWYQTPGECCIQDAMQELYPQLREADLLVLATPVYIPLPGAMQNVINRLCPLVEPHLEFRQGRTRARLRPEVKIKKFVLVSTGGWWEKENMETVVRIVQELADNASVDFSGAILRPHAFLMVEEGQVTGAGQEILEAVRRAAHELVEQGAMEPATLDVISRPLISEAELRQLYNQLIS